MVAGEVAASREVSSTIVIEGDKYKDSPVDRVKRLLSSRTEFRFSTQSGSIDPSNVISCFLPLLSLAAYLKK